MERKYLKKFIPFVLILLLISIMSGCGKDKIRKPQSIMDNPEHHTNNGNKYLEKGDLNKAFESYDRALQLDPKYSPALVGTAVIYGMKGNYKAAFKQIDKAKGMEKQIGLIRLYSMERGKNWYEYVQDEFKKGIKLDPNNPELWYYAGYAHKVNYNFDKSSEAYKKVLEINKDFTEKANEDWALVQRIQRAAPGTAIGNKIALIESIDRADVAALFIEELKLDNLYEKKGVKNIDTSFKAPETTKEFKTETVTKTAKVTDITNHELKADIENVINLGVRGLEVFPDHTFQADKKITRVEYAVMIEDILIKITGDETMATKFIGMNSPYLDVRNDHFAFNAIMTVTTRGILEAKTNGEFGMENPISGADALLAIRKLKEELKL
ncbi:MAG: tetratricopeptide repeat protein [Candidatus Firestonebacteria bacterium]|nr:tetratricopeptide repeat protein [Candidatus Firestonebacteria bacterium]